MPGLIQRTELKTFYYTPVHCPFCGVRVMGADPEDETRITACPHTLFIAHDTAFEYRSERLDENLRLNGLSEREIKAKWNEDAGGIDGFTDKISLADAIKVAAYAPAPSAYGSYYGFAPVE
ncbi:hypothetical protein [Thauera butanivorans]|uniref:hypothetical protein n=1 Tax=Thauera butanivorans TaxID=86174 RepID=UPI000837F2DE|nr:hypothetical protein [Thauera butanivorans]